MLSHLLDDRLKFRRYRLERVAPDLHLAIGTALAHHVERRVRIILGRKTVAKMPAATLLTLQRRARDRLGNRQQMRQVQRRMPPRIVIAIPRRTDLPRPFPEL